VDLLRRLFGSDRPRGAESDAETRADPGNDGGEVDVNAHLHLVTVWLRLSAADFGDEREQRRVFALEDRVMRGVWDAGVGDHETNQLERGFFGIRLVGPDADRIVGIVLPLVAGDLPAGSYLAVRRGPAGTGEDRVDLPAPGGA
jgi:hypothetical protein